MWEPAVCSRGSGSWMVHGWSGSGTGMERYGTGSGTKRPTPAQLCHHEAHLYQNWQCGARVAQQAILRLLDCQLATAKRISTIKHHSPQRAATVSGAGANLPQVEREGGLQAIHSWLPADNSQAHSSHNKRCRHRLANTITGLGHSKPILACTHSCMYERSSMRDKCKIRLHIFRCIYIYIS